ncbi:Pyrimidine 5'-nucleotidase [Paragonimus heterotremus]|uniref:5'-nucleotidase n=1 Tax=Paragonimus heterotremus TaxID=100268 RepID=A0A8J4WJI2_9TREM|nr:Pyrimidine 5'-nucleotidase [Paragonimus heterotremus]
MRYLCEASSNGSDRNKFFTRSNIDALLSSFINSCVVLSNEEKLIKQLSAMAQDGHQQLQIISDFDYTITKYVDGGQKMLTTHEAIEMHPNMKKHSISELRKLRDTYLPIETSCVKDPVLLRQHMDAWWNQSYSILLANPITRRMIVEVEQFAPIVFRQEFTDFAAYLRSVWIPLTVFSAGLGDVIAQLMQSAHMSMENVLIAANYMRFGRNGVAYAFTKPIICVHNKTLQILKQPASILTNRSEQLMRRNVILLGDSPHDVHMTNGHHFNTVLKIGFLNHPTSQSIEQYKQIYDMVLTKHESFRVPLNLIKWICTFPKSLFK